MGDGSNPITNLSTNSQFTQSFFPGIEINNDKQIVAVNYGVIRLLDADNQGIYKRTIGSAMFGNEFTDFDNIFPFASINNTTPPESEESEVVFNEIGLSISHFALASGRWIARFYRYMLS